MKTLSAAIAVALFLIFTACGNQDKSTGQAEEAPASVTAPQIDLHSAVVAGDLEAIRQHIQAGTDLNVQEPSRASTPLITAAFLGKAEAAKLLIDAGADLNYKNNDGSSALHTAAAFGKTEVAKLLIDAGANLSVKNNNGATPLHTAAFFGHVEIVRALLDKGADKAIRNSAGQTAYETVATPFEEARPVYDAIGAGLMPMGLKLDYDSIKAARPRIAEMLK